MFQSPQVLPGVELPAHGIKCHVNFHVKGMLEYLLGTTNATSKLIFQKIVQSTMLAKSVATYQGHWLHKHAQAERALQFSLHQLFLAIPHEVRVRTKTFSLGLPSLVYLPVNPAIDRGITAFNFDDLILSQICFVVR